MAKVEKSSAQKKPNIFQRIIAAVKRYFAETIGELRKVSWPTRREAWYLTVVVLIVTIIMSIFLGVILDSLFSYLVKLIVG